MKAVYAGSFDPFTNGHLEIVKEAAKFFDHLVIVIANNIKKTPFFNKDGMAQAIVEMLKDEGLDFKVSVRVSSDMTADICREENANYLVRGLRNTTDYMNEEEIAKVNKRLNPRLKTVYFRATDETMSSSLVRELLIRGKDVQEYVPRAIYEYIKGYSQAG